MIETVVDRTGEIADHGLSINCSQRSVNEPGLMVQADQINSLELPAEVALSMLQGKWKIRILSQLQSGPSRLSHLRRQFPSASKKMLTQHLRELEEDGIIIRSDLSGSRRHVEYSLETKLGDSIAHLIDVLASWGNALASDKR